MQEIVYIMAGGSPSRKAARPVLLFARQYEIPIFFPVLLDKKNQFVEIPVKCRPLHRRHVTHIYLMVSLP